MSPDVIVFGDDATPHSDRAWLWINSQRWPGWAVDVVTAQPERGDVTREDLPVRSVPWNPTVPRSADPRSGLAEVRHLRSLSDPRDVLAALDDVALLVVGPRGSHGRARAKFAGSTADHLLHSPPVPLVIANTPNPASRVLVCTDGSPAAQHAVETFAALPLAAEAAVWVIGVDHSDMLDEHHPDDERIDRGVSAALDTLGPAVVETIRLPSDGDVAARISERARALGAQLLVVGTRGHTGLKRLLLGSTCHALARSAPCSLLVVPPPDR